MLRPPQCDAVCDVTIICVHYVHSHTGTHLQHLLRLLSFISRVVALAILYTTSCSHVFTSPILRRVCYCGSEYRDQLGGGRLVRFSMEPSFKTRISVLCERI